jgi:glycosyltransferase involved in cell wall biosynthesis
MKVVVCIPVHNDWQAAQALLAQLDSVASHLPHEFDVLFVDDASTEPPPASLNAGLTRLARVSALRLRRNLGPQRAIATGLAHLSAYAAHDAVLVMDGDGEDNPEHIPALVGKFLAFKASKVVFAGRTYYAGGLLRRVCYALYRLLYRWLVGRSLPGGSFSLLSRNALERLVASPDLWNHYASAVQRSRVEIDSVPASPGRRLAGSSKMSIPALFAQGFAAISVHAEVAVVRWFLTLVLATVVGYGISWLTCLIPGIGCSGHVVRRVAMLSAVSSVLGLPIVIGILRGRSFHEFIPARDSVAFVVDEYEWPRG